MGYRWAAHGPRGAAPWELQGRRHGNSGGGAGVSSIAPPLKVRGALPLEVPGDKFLGQHFQVWWFLGPPDQNELYQTPLLPKMRFRR